MAPETPRGSGGPWTVIFALFAAGNLANGLWMLADPVHWYVSLPANVPGTGPLNEHFVRDIGCVFTLIGVALAIAVARPKFRVTALAFAAGFYVAHSLVHVWDQVRGLLPPDQWKFDLVPVYGATVVLVVLLWVLMRGAPRSGAT
ncbi:MAG: hypothetical protein AAGF92_06800 [Myxococcota bacterium]